jgi:low affinity Fe/Cu permease
MPVRHHRPATQPSAGRHPDGKRPGRRVSLPGTLEHPADRIAHRQSELDRRRRTRFDRFAQRASFLASSPFFFVVCTMLVLAWALGFAFGASDRWEAAAAGLMSAVTLMLVAVMKNSELRAERAVQQKLDAIAASLLEDRRGDSGDAEDAERQLESSIGLHEEI